MKILFVFLISTLGAYLCTAEMKAKSGGKDSADGGITCIVCQSTLQLISANLLAHPTVLHNIGQSVLGACNEVPDEQDRDVCRQLLGDHFPEFFQNLVHEPGMAPEKLCSHIGLC